MPKAQINLQNPNDWPFVLTCPQVGKILGVSHSKIYDMVKKKQIPSVRLGGVVRIPSEAFRNWLTDKSQQVS